MKKTVLNILIFCMAFLVLACNGNTKSEKKGGDFPDETNIKVPTETSTSELGISNGSESNLIYTFKDPGMPVAFDYPNLKSIEEGTSQVFKNSRYVIAYCRDTKDAELTNIPDELADIYKDTTDTHIEGVFDSFSIDSTVYVDIDGIKVMKMKGYVVAVYDDGSKINLPMQGYTFAKEGSIFELIAVLSEESNDANQKEMEDTIDAMIKTLRDDR